MNVLRQIKPSRLYRLSSVRLVSGSTLTPRWTRNTRETLVTPQPTLASFSRSLATTSATEEELMQKISKCINSGDVVVFMKGVPEAPRCGFSNAVCQIFRMHDVKITSYDVLSDEELRQGVKEYSKWPTYPQVFFKGELMGGCDIMLQMHQSGDLIEELEKIGLKSALAQEEEPKPEDSKK